MLAPLYASVAIADSDNFLLDVSMAREWEFLTLSPPCEASSLDIAQVELEIHKDVDEEAINASNSSELSFSAFTPASWYENEFRRETKQKESLK